MSWWRFKIKTEMFQLANTLFINKIILESRWWRKCPKVTQAFFNHVSGRPQGKYWFSFAVSFIYLEGFLFWEVFVLFGFFMGHFLHRLDPNVRKETRRLKRLHTKIIRKTLLPKYTQTHTHTHTHTYICMCVSMCECVCLYKTSTQAGCDTWSIF